ncbi:MAG TPA: hypothetical protein PK945_06535 [Bacillota bacterium]|nr:hypothetical protein [Bacillota bacterium]HOL02549.1 hypothetical protein [Bacillota bacterium]HPO81005.1 hypothetical protein [Bacillota bacterium]HPU61152.1 hypothetical protein [Bacillota bacterium]
MFYADMVAATNADCAMKSTTVLDSPNTAPEDLEFEHAYLRFRRDGTGPNQAESTFYIIPFLVDDSSTTLYALLDDYRRIDVSKKLNTEYYIFGASCLRGAEEAAFYPLMPVQGGDIR